MTDLNSDTGGTSQRRGVYGDPWRQPSQHIVHDWPETMPTREDVVRGTPLEHHAEIPRGEAAIAFWAFAVMVGAIAAGIVANLL